MAYFAAILLLISTAVAQSPRPLPDQPTSRKIEYMAMKVSAYGVETPVDFACARFSAPDAQDTPNPILANESKVIVDAVVGWDGKIYSPFILSTEGVSADKSVLKALHSWRFRPATCNGSPINTEAHITFVR